MIHRLTPGFIALGCAMMVSCYPYNENTQKPIKKPATDQTVTSPAQQEIKDERAKLKKKKDLAKKNEMKQRNESADSPSAGDSSPKPKSSPSTTAAPPAPEKPKYPYANKIPGKDGFVFSPYNNKPIDVRGMASGTLVQDPTFSDEKRFRVP